MRPSSVFYLNWHHGGVLIARFSALLLGVIIWTGCVRGDVQRFEEYRFSEAGWHKDSACVVQIQVEDTLQPYALDFYISHTTEYPNSNLYLFIEVEAPGGTHFLDTVNYPLCNADGSWLGSGIGSRKKLILPYADDLTFSNLGLHVLRVRHGMRYDYLPGCMSFGVRLSDGSAGR